MKRYVFALGLLGILAVGYFAVQRHAPGPTAAPVPLFTDISPAKTSEMLAYLVQSVCLDADGRPTERLVIDPDCGNTRLMDESDPVLWRKHDWGGVGGTVAGWQASDAVLAKRQDVSFVDQTFDFGAPATDNAGRPDAFRRFDPNDGGDAIMIVGDTASVFLTQDAGTPGLQWFIGRGCAAKTGRGRYLSWILFKADLGPEWQSVVAELSSGIPRDTCPQRYNRALTRYRLVNETFPFQRLASNSVPIRQTASVPTVIVEHFDAGIFGNAHALERFYYAKGLGKVRWEAWVTEAAKASQAELLARSGRCAALADSGAPASDWRMVDCRMWTNIVTGPTRNTWRVRDFGWPPHDLTLQ